LGFYHAQVVIVKDRVLKDSSCEELVGEIG
jgi:hypothetical protein